MKNEDYISRFKDAPFITEEPLDIIIGGAGGISSWLIVLLSRLQHNLHIYDFDSYEAHNLSGQLIDIQSIGKNKAEAIKELALKLSGNTDIDCYGKYEESSMASNIMICGFDNMEARKTFFNNWLAFVETQEDKSSCIYIDGRLTAETFQIFTLVGDDVNKIKIYQEYQLFADGEVEEAICTFKQTSHIAAMIASMMVANFTNYLVNYKEKDDIRAVQYYIEYISPLNMLSNVLN